MSFCSVFGPHTKTLSSSVNFEVSTGLIHELFEQYWTEWCSREAYINGLTGQSLTYGALLQKVQVLAGKIQALGVKEDEIVIFSSKTSFKSCLIILALFLNKSPVIICKHAFKPFEVQNTFKNVSAGHVFADSGTFLKMKDFASTHQTIKNVFCIDDDDLWSEKRNLFVKPPASDPRKTVALMTFTSGSTGVPKAVMLTHYNIEANSWPFKLNKSPEDCTFLLSNPLSHLSGIITLLQPLQRGGRIIISDENLRENIESYADTIERYKCSHLLAMPVTFKLLTDNYDVLGAKLRCVKQVWTGGSMLPQPLLCQFHKNYPNIIVQDLYGMSECSGWVTMSHNAVNDRGLQLVPNCQVRIEDVTTRKVLGPEEQGEIVIKGPVVFMGYLNRPDATAETLSEDGWLRSGDIGYFRKDNYGLVIVDRLKQMIKCLDSQVTPAELEQVLLENGKVLNALVVGVPHEKYGEAPTAFVVPKNPEEVDLEKLAKELIDDIKNKLSYFKQLHGGVYFVNDILKTDTGKFSRSEMLRCFLNKKLVLLS